jgi:hypothetical protein
MLWGAVAESTHTHPNKSESASCSLCVVAHSTAPSSTIHQARPVFAAIGLLQEEELIAKARISISEFGIRGPPTV